MVGAQVVIQSVVYICVFATSLAYVVPQKRIENGKLAANLSHPYLVSVQARPRVLGDWNNICGGVLIATNKILTAAHCLTGRSKENMRISMGVTNLLASASLYHSYGTVRSYIIHEDYRGNENDLAVIYLSEHVRLNKGTQIADLPPKGVSFTNTKCVMAGWARSYHLREANVNAISTSECKARFSDKEISPKNICAYSDAGDIYSPSGCNGDSGGPIMCGNNFKYLAGIISWGIKRCSVVALAAAGPEKRMVNGSPAALFAHPYQASLQVQSSGSWHHSCGGSIISRTKILTAAHCVQGQTASRLRVEVGALDLNAAPNVYEQTVGVASFVIHASYNGKGAGLPNDIGIITLSTPLTLNSNVQIATLAPKGSSFAKTKCIITGWGRTVGGGATSSRLMEARVTKITTAECAARWPGQNINIKHICVYEAAAASGTRPSACNGDSGGPMMCGSSLQYLAGITSWGVSNCNGNYPSVYTRVSEYLDWIAARV